MSIFQDISGIAGQVSESIPVIGGALSVAFEGISGLFGGGTRSCVEKEAQVREAIQKYLTLSDMERLVRPTESDVDPNAGSMARFFVGGKDCLHKNVSPGDQRFLDDLPRLVEQRATEAEARARTGDPAASNFRGGTTSSSSTGASSSGSYRPSVSVSRNGAQGTKPGGIDTNTLLILAGVGLVAFLITQN